VHPNQISTQRLDHLGIVAGICHEINLVERIDSKIVKETNVLTVGQAVMAMVLNALGFVGRPLYLTPEYFRNKPVDLLIHPDVEADHLNQHNLGRALDALFEAGITEVFVHMSVHALRKFGIKVRQARLDSTSFSLQGAYPNQDEDNEAATITFGYSKDHRPDLKQMILNLICANSSSIPMWLQALSGNTSDSTQFPEAIRAYCDQLDDDTPTPVLIIDSAVYSKGNLDEISDCGKWISKAPNTIKAVKDLYTAVDAEDLTVLDEETRYFEWCSVYGGIKQRWTLVQHAPTRARAQQTFAEQLEKERQQAQKQLQRLRNKTFDCEDAAQKAVSEQAKRWRFHQAQVSWKQVPRYDKPGRPAADAVPRMVWQLETAQVVEDEEAIAAQRAKHGRYVLATNELDADQLPVESIITLYKQQSISVERGFRFLKDPMFFAHSLFLKKPSRIMALLMVMGLSLLIYALAEHRLRAEMAARDETIPDQKGYPTQRPTMRRIFQMFEGIDVLIMLEGGRQRRLIVNLTDLHRQILGYFSHHVRKIYDLPV
jgi:transposase